MQNSIKVWVQKIQGRPLASLSLIKDQEYLQNLVVKLSPSFFKTVSSSYDTLIDSIVEYYRKKINIDVSHSMKIAKSNQDTLQLWVIVLGIAIKGEERNQNINVILSLDQKVQSSLMGFISRIDDTLDSCPSLQLQASGKKQGNNLQKHLLNTIEQLSQQNNVLRSKIQQIQDQFSTYRMNKQTLIQNQQQSLKQIHAEREQILNQYQGIYNTDNLSVIIKAIIAENNLLNQTLEKRQNIAVEIELEKQDLIKKIEKLAENNKILKSSLSNFELLQAKCDEQQEQIAQLRKTQNQLLAKVFKLQRGDSPTKFERRPVNRSNSFEPIIQQDQHNPRTSQSYRPPVQTTPNKYTQKLLRSIKRKGTTTVTAQLQPYEREKQHITLIQTQQQKLQQLAKQLQQLSEQLQVKSAEIKYSAQKNKQVEEKLKHIEGKNEMYANNIKQKENIIIQKNEEYEIKFGELMAQIQSLKIMAEKANDQTKIVQNQSSQKIQQNSNKYEQKLKTIMDMLQAELISFRNKQLQYLQNIRLLKANKGQDFFNSIVELGKSAFKMQRSDNLSEVSQQVVINNQQQRQSSQYKLARLDSRMSKKSSNSECNLGQIQNKVTSLLQQVSLLKTHYSQTQKKIQQSFTRQTNSIKQITTLTEQSLLLKQTIEQLRQKFIKYLEQDIERLKGTHNSQQAQNQNSIQNINEKMRSLQNISKQLEQLKKNREQGKQQIESQKQKLILFLKQQLKGVSKLKRAHQNENTQGITQISLDETQYDKYLQIEKQFEQVTKQNQNLKKQVLSLQSQVNKLKQQIILVENQKQASQRKLSEVQSKLRTETSCNIDHYSEISHLIDQIKDHKQKQREQDSIISSLQTQVQLNTSSQQENQSKISPLKAANNKLIKDYQKQTYLFSLFRNKYRELLEKYRGMQEQHRLIVSAFTDMIITAS